MEENQSSTPIVKKKVIFLINTFNILF